jgi:hypothetical protein
MELFLSTRCEFGIVGQEFTKMGWGFVSIISNLFNISYLTMIYNSLNLSQYFMID